MPFAEIKTTDVPSLLRLTPATRGTIEATLRDERGKVATSVKLTLINAILDKVEWSVGLPPSGLGVALWRSSPLDGRTSPLSFAMGDRRRPRRRRRVKMPNGVGSPLALMVPAKRVRCIHMVDQVASIADYAEPILGIDRDQGDRAHIRFQGDGWLFVTRSPTHTLLFPADHPEAGRPRYAWIPRDYGSLFGFPP